MGVVPEEARPGIVYRAYDSAGRLLYVGSTVNLAARRAHHRDASHWYRNATRWDLQEFRTISAARWAEAQAIRIENPRWNKTWNPAWHQPRPQREQSAPCGRCGIPVRRSRWGRMFEARDGRPIWHECGPGTP